MSGGEFGGGVSGIVSVRRSVKLSRMKIAKGQAADTACFNESDEVGWGVCMQL